MAIREVKNFDQINAALRDIHNQLDYLNSHSLDFHGRRIKNASPSKDDYDYVVRKELHDLVGGAISQPARRVKGGGGSAATYDKSTFGVGVGASCIVGDRLTPPYEWTNSRVGKPVIVAVACNTPPLGSKLIFDILVKKDPDAQPFSIFKENPDFNPSDPDANPLDQFLYPYIPDQLPDTTPPPDPYLIAPNPLIFNKAPVAFVFKNTMLDIVFERYWCVNISCLQVGKIVPGGEVNLVIYYELQ